MNILILGAGRMGIRHAKGALNFARFDKIILADISDEVLFRASSEMNSLKGSKIVDYVKVIDLEKRCEKYEVVIIASTAGNRIENVKIAHRMGCEHLLIEKPLGQSMKEVSKLNAFCRKQGIKTYVNLAKRCYDCFVELKNNFKNMPQFNGEINISINMGAIGIGVMGIHYLDILFFLYDAHSAKIVAGEVDETLISSGRGPQFCDFGGWCTIYFFAESGKRLGRTQFSISSISSAFGVIQIIAPHAIVTIDEMQQRQTYQLRKPESHLPLYRYASDYNEPQQVHFEISDLSQVTFNWLNSIFTSGSILPEIATSLKAHQLMFDWLSMSKTHSNKFPIT